MSTDSADRQYEMDSQAQDVPPGNAQDNDYTSRTGQKEGPIPVQSDNDPVPVNNAVDDPDSDKALRTLL